jgi:hypothetical protein
MSGLKYTNHTLHKIEDLFKASEYIIRYERGNFNSGYCILEEKKVVVINKFYDAEARINCLLEIMDEILILEDNLDEKQMAFYQLLQEMHLDKAED